MKQALALTDTFIMQAINDHFGLQVVKMSFTPVGENSWLYKVTDMSGKPYAVKLQHENNQTVDAVRRYLERYNYPYTPKILLTKDNRVQAKLNDLYVSVEEYIEHDDDMAHDASPDRQYLAMLGKVLHTLHTVAVVPSELGDVPTETFQSAFLPLAKASVASFKRLNSNKPEVRSIIDVLQKKATVIEKLFSCSLEYGSRLSAQPLPLVLTHGDVHFGNTLESKTDKFYIIDWDWTMLARPAYDLMYFSDAQLSDISIGYGSDLLQQQDELNYYRNHLMLRFLWFWLGKAAAAKTEADLQAAASTLVAVLDDSTYWLRAF